MHVIFRESHGLEENETPRDLGQTPADLVVLSFSDSDLGAFAAGWHRAEQQAKAHNKSPALPSLRLANIAALKHPLSVDTYVEQTLSGAKGILIRLIGGLDYWPYGMKQIEALARARGIALAVLPADGRKDTRLDEVSTLPLSTLRRLAHLCDTGGAVAAQAALAQFALASGLYAAPVAGGGRALPEVGAYTLEHGVSCPLFTLNTSCKPLVVVVFYRSYLISADLAPVDAVCAELRSCGFEVLGVFVPSLKAPEAAAWLSRQMLWLRPVSILNLTAFSGKGAGGESPLDGVGVPVFQAALATTTREVWAGETRGLSCADLAMHVVLPEVDGRIFAGVISFKGAQKRDPALQFSRVIHCPHPERIRALAARIAAWHRLGSTAPAQRRVALVLSTYPGRAWNMAHAIGLDALASSEALLDDLHAAGYEVRGDACGEQGAAPDDEPWSRSCGAYAQSDAQSDAQGGARGDEQANRCGAHTATRLSDARVHWPMEAYRAALAQLPAALQKQLAEAWGAPEDDVDATPEHITFIAQRRGRALVALQPERGTFKQREDEYHDLARVPRHAYVAFYLWLRESCDALIHMGAHGTLEWLPGKAVALCDECWPEALTGALPVLYPFIVNDPGEAAQAKRRLGALTLGHLPPPLKTSGTPERFGSLESLLDEFSSADGLDPRRRDRLQSDIYAEARALGLESDLDLMRASSTPEAIARIDRFVCDVKDSQFGDGLHIWGRVPHGHTPPFDVSASIENERRALLDALGGARIAPGAAGSPYRGRMDVLPTGRNLFCVDPRAVPSRNAFAQGVTLAEELVRRHAQDHGDWPRALVVDLWGSATMRTAGEEFSMALHLIGVRPLWDASSARVSGFDIVPIAELARPRLDVTLRVSGLFRDVFAPLTMLFTQAVAALSARDEAADWNPYVGKSAAPHRVYGPAPGSFGAGMSQVLGDYSSSARRAAGEAWLAASSWALGGAQPEHDPAGIRARVAGADSFVHLQDMLETDVLLSEDYAAHEAGFAAAQSALGAERRAALYHLDTADPARPRARTLPEEIARTVYARAAHPGWIAGMQRHGFRGAAEIASTLENMAAFAQLSDTVAPHLFDTFYEATLGNENVAAFLRAENPQAFAAMQARFRALYEAGLWQSRRNAIVAHMMAV